MQPALESKVETQNWVNFIHDIEGDLKTGYTSNLYGYLSLIFLALGVVLNVLPIKMELGPIKFSTLAYAFYIIYFLLLFGLRWKNTKVDAKIKEHVNGHGLGSEVQVTYYTQHVGVCRQRGTVSFLYTCIILKIRSSNTQISWLHVTYRLN